MARTLRRRSSQQAESCCQPRSNAREGVQTATTENRCNDGVKRNVGERDSAGVREIVDGRGDVGRVGRLATSAADTSAAGGDERGRDEEGSEEHLEGSGWGSSEGVWVNERV